MFTCLSSDVCSVHMYTMEFFEVFRVPELIRKHVPRTHTTVLVQYQQCGTVGNALHYVVRVRFICVHDTKQALSGTHKSHIRVIWRRVRNGAKRKKWQKSEAIEKPRRTKLLREDNVTNALRTSYSRIRRHSMYATHVLVYAALSNGRLHGFCLIQFRSIEFHSLWSFVVACRCKLVHVLWRINIL